MTSWTERFTPYEIRRLVINANDGLLVGAGIVEGLSIAKYDNTTIMLAACAALAAGAFAAANGTYTELRTETEATEAFLREEARLQKLSAEEELEELTEIYVEKGLSANLARQVAQELPAEEALTEYAVYELGYAPDYLEPRPLLASAYSGAAFALGAGIPLMVTLALPGGWSIGLLIAAVIIGLTLTSVISARSSQMSMWRTIRRSIISGLLALAVTAIFGLATN